MSGPFARSRGEECLSDQNMDALLAEALDADPLRAAESHLSGCPACAARLAELRFEQQSFAAIAPPLGVLRAAPPKVISIRRWAVPISIAAGVLLAWFGWAPVERSDRLLSKGGAPELGFFVKHGDHVRRGSSGEVVEPGDALRFTYSSPKKTYLTILSRDPRAAISIYFPARSGAGAGTAPSVSEEEPAGRDQPLPLSTVLDQTVGAETLFGLFCDAPIDEPAARAALADNAALPAGCRRVSVPIVKRAP